MQSSTTLTGPGGLADRIGPAITALAGVLDERRDMPAELIAELRDAGAFGLLTPRELGGREVPPTVALTLYEELGRVDASVAWTVWNGNFGFIGALLGETGVARIWRKGQDDPVFANGLTEGVARPAGDGYQLSGTWPMVSGVSVADWVVVVAVVHQDGGYRVTEAGLPDVRLFAIPRAGVTVKDTWHVTGLRGTGSSDVRLDEVHVPEEMTARLNVPAQLDRPLYRGYIPALVLPGGTAIALGVAAAAIDEVVATAKASGTADSPYVQVTVAESEADLKAARLLLYSAAGSMQTANEQAEPVTGELRAELRAAMSHAARVSRRVLTAGYELGGPLSLYAGNPLERRFRDGMAVLQHASHSADAFAGAGRVRLGLPPGLLHF